MAHNIYVDESGTGPAETVRIVAALIVDVDKKWLAAERALNDVLALVPPHFRDGFHFHAKDLWGNAKYRADWRLGDRIDYMKRVMSIPRQLGIPIAVGMARKDAAPLPAELRAKRVKQHEWEHTLAFSNALNKSDRYLRYYCNPAELGTVICEDVSMNKKLIHGIVDGLRKDPYSLVVDRHERKITQIIDRVHFVEKSGAPLLQLADACAFAFRRFLFDQDYGQEFVDTIVGAEVVRKEWQGPASEVLYPWRASL